jgi:glycosyltransferase involved in cell wall biosynthesis
MEAMAAGKPVIATAVGGVPELVQDGKSGVLVPPGDVEALAEAILRLAGDAHLRRQLGQEASKQAKERFDVSVMVKGYAALYEQLLEKS